MQSSSAWRERLPDIAVLVACAAGAVGLWSLQDATPTLRGDANAWAIAVVALVAQVGVTAMFQRAGRKRTGPRVELLPGVLTVVHASQTGRAEALAERTAATLAAAGVPSVAIPIAELDAARLRAATRVLFVASTTGEGDAPDTAARFVRDVMARELRLDHLRFGVLALGDREYANFCAFGRRLDGWLRRHGAQPLFDVVEVDDNDPGALRHWLHNLRQLGGDADMADWQAPAYRAWRLVERRCLNPGSLGGPAFHLELQPEDPADLAWIAGDIAEVGPRHAPAVVDHWLARHALDGETPCRREGRIAPLAHWLAGAHLPDQAIGSAQVVVDALERLPHREYSIASVPEDGAVHLLVRQHRRPDGTPGLAGSWLCEHAAIGAAIELRIRANAAFRAPAGDQPMLLVGNGTGIAGLRALLKARELAGGGRHWLVFGERQATVDRFYRDDIERWRDAGMLELVDLVHSRDGGNDRYVQDRLMSCADEVRSWIDAGASIHVCGSLAGMSTGVDAALRAILGSERVDALREAGRYRRDVY